MKRSAIQTALLYAIATGVWIFGIDLAIDTIVGDHVWLVRLHAILGVLAVAVVYAVVSKQLRGRRLAEQALRQEQAELESRVQKRTAQLEKMNQDLQSEIGLRVLAEKNLRMIERDLASQKATLKGVMDSAKGPIFSVDRNYCYTSFNSRHAEVMKELYGAEISIGGNLLEYHTNPHDRSLAQMNIDRALRGEVVTIESSAGDEARSRRYFEIAHHPVMDSSGQVTGAAVFVRDITELKRAEEAVRQREALIDAFFESSQDVLIIHDEEFRFIKADIQTPSYFGLDRQTIVGKSSKDLAPELIRDYGAMMREVMETGEPKRNVEVHAPVPSRPGEISCWRASFFRVPLPDGKRGIGIMGVEITDLQKTEQELRTTRNYLEALFNYANAPIIVWDQEFRITGFNKAFERLTGRSAEDVIGEPLEILFPGDLREEARTLLRRTQTGERWETVEIPILRADGSVRSVLWNSATLFAKDGKTVTATIAQGQDITERKQAEEESSYHLESVQFMAETATTLLKQETTGQVFEYVAEKVSGLFSDTFVIVNEYDPADRCTVVRAVGGERSGIEIISSILGKELKGLRLTFDPATRQRMTPGTLMRVEGGIDDLSFGLLSEPLRWQLEEELGLDTIYVIPFSWGDEFLGSLTILARLKDLGRNARVIEALVSQSSIALSRLRSEEALRQREREYRGLMEEASDGIILADSEGHFVAANSKAYELVGYSSDEIGSFRVNDLVPPEDIPLLSVCYDDIASGKAAIVEHRLRRKDGSHLEVETSARKLANGHYQAILREITDRKRTEAEFARAVQPEAFDKLFAALREIRHGEGLAMNLHRISLFAKNIQVIMEESAEDGGPASGHGQKGSSGPVHSSARARLEIAVNEFLKIGYQKLRGIAALLRIVESEINQGASPGEEQVFAHDVLARTELLKIDVEEALQFVQRRRNGGPTVGYSELGNRIAESVEALVHGIAEIGRQLNAHFTSNVNEVVRSIMPSFQGSHADTTIEVREESGVLKAIIGPADLSEVLSLLITNSLDALAGVAAEEKKIIVRLGVKDSRGRIEVEDNGPGVPAEIRGRVFEAGITTKGSGRGYGLSYAREHLRKYGGTLAYDERFQHGARFIIDLVLA